MSAEVLGEGSFGCVLKPQVPCDSPAKKIRATSSKNLVGKIFVDKKDFMKEVRASKIVATVDPNGQNILTPSEYCNTSVDHVLSNSSATECEAIRDVMYAPNNPTLYQLTMPYGGERLDKQVRSNNLSKKKFLELMLPIFEGLVLLEDKGYCHQDIKASNLLITPAKKAIMIDYSLMIPLKDVYASKNIRRLRHTYFPYPPEYKIFYKMYKHLCGKKDCDTWEEVLKNITHYGPTRSETFFELYPEADVKKDLERFVAWTQEFSSKSKLEGAFKEVANVVDVYSVGTVFVDMYPYTTDKGCTKKFLGSYKKLVQSMIAMDPRDRMTPKTLLARVKSML
jgi:serine/threonine protein kinase